MKIRSLIVASLILSSLSFCSPANAAEPVVLSESTLTPSIAGVGNIWTGKIPTKVSFPTSTYCPNLAFPIQGLLPFSVLSDRALGVSVEFEVWAANGSRTSNNTVYSSSWNPTGPNTEVSISLPYQCAGIYTMLVRTIYETKTNGLITNYLKDEKKLSIEIIGGGTLTSSASSVKSSKDYTANIAAVGTIWSASIPTEISYPETSYSSYLEFQINALQPFAILADRSTGTSIEFEIWDSAGKQVASDTFSAYDWNPVATNTLASIYLGSDVGSGSYTLIYRTIYKTSSNGLLSNYLKTEGSQTLVISGKTRPKIKAPQILSSIEYTSSIIGVGNIWSASLPKQVQLPDSSYSDLEFNIKGLLPISVLTDRALGVSVDFEIWSEKGVQIASETVYSSDWNTKGPDTLVSMTLFTSKFNEPTTLRVVTTYSTRTNGLLSSYLEDVDIFQITVLGKSTATTESGKTTTDAAYVANIKQAGDIWRGSIPTEVALPTSGYSKQIQFQVEGLLPYKTLADRSLGVSVEFEIWSDAGEKIGYDTLYSFEWNPVGPKTLVSISLPSELLADTFTLLIKTIYETNTDGLQSRYLESRTAQKLKVTGGTTKASPTHTIVESKTVTSSIAGVGNIWTGNIPSKIALNPQASSSKISFQIQAILPYATVADLSTGTSVEFEVWSSAGKKVTYETVYSSEWNPVGIKSLVKMYIWSDMVADTYTIIVRTIYKTNSNGLLSNYLKDEKTFPFVVVDSGEIKELAYFREARLSQKSIPGIASKYSSTNKNEPIVVSSSTPNVCSVVKGDLLFYKKGNCKLLATQKGAGLFYDSSPIESEFEIVTNSPDKISQVESTISASGTTYTWVAPASDEKITKYEIGFSASTSANLTAGSGSSYSDYVTKDSTSQNSYTVTPTQIYTFLRSIPSSSGIAGIHFRVSVRAVSEAGTGQYWAWNYTEASSLKSYFWSQYPAALDFKEIISNGEYFFNGVTNQTSSTHLSGSVTKYSWRFTVAPAGVNFSQYSYDPKGIEFASTSTNSILEDTAFLAIEKYKKDFPVGGAVLFMVHGMSGDQESLDSRGAGIYFLTEDLLKYIDDTKEKIAAAELKAKQEAEAKAAAELKAKQDAEAKAAADKAAAELKAKQDAEAKAAATKKTTITCVKGKLTKKVTAVKPACPTGYKKK